MSRAQVLVLVVHGLLLALLGMLLGFPLQHAITADGSPQAQLAWRSSHTTLVTGGTLYVAVAAVGQHLALGARAARFATSVLVLASYVFAAVLCAGPLLGARGLQPVGPPAHVAVHLGFLAAIALLFAGLGVILWGACSAVARSRSA